MVRYFLTNGRDGKASWMEVDILLFNFFQFDSSLIFHFLFWRSIRNSMNNTLFNFSRITFIHFNLNREDVLQRIFFRFGCKYLPPYKDQECWLIWFVSWSLLANAAMRVDLFSDLFGISRVWSTVLFCQCINIPDSFVTLNKMFLPHSVPCKVNENECEHSKIKSIFQIYDSIQSFARHNQTILETIWSLRKLFKCNMIHDIDVLKTSVPNWNEFIDSRAKLLKRLSSFHVFKHEPVRQRTPSLSSVWQVQHRKLGIDLDLNWVKFEYFYSIVRYLKSMSDVSLHWHWHLH